MIQRSSSSRMTTPSFCATVHIDMFVSYCPEPGARKSMVPASLNWTNWNTGSKVIVLAYELAFALQLHSKVEYAMRVLFAINFLRLHFLPKRKRK